MLMQCDNGSYNMVTKRTDIKTGNQISLLGFGCMRFPLMEINENGAVSKAIDIKKTAGLIDYAITHGINYFEVAYNYHDEKAESTIGSLLKKYPRHSFYLADEMPTWKITDLESGKKLFQEQLDRCQVEYFDYYMLHAPSEKEEYIRAYNESGVYDYLLEEKAAGRIKQIGFSFHGNEELFDFLLSHHEWDFAQIQLNYMDWDDQNAEYLYNELTKRNIPVVVMEPLQGGILAKLDGEAETELHHADTSRSIASWAFKYAASLPNVITVLSGMTQMDHLKDNIKTFTGFKPLTGEEYIALEKAKNVYRKNKKK